MGNFQNEVAEQNYFLVILASKHWQTPYRLNQLSKEL
tara:strand:+ start:613 stop:723 length:111 start_codon:yes stop_codon:yes gene_type:complete